MYFSVLVFQSIPRAKSKHSQATRVHQDWIMIGQDQDYHRRYMNILQYVAAYPKYPTFVLQDRGMVISTSPHTFSHATSMRFGLLDVVLMSSCLRNGRISSTRRF